jgi:hypothetical protein
MPRATSSLPMQGESVCTGVATNICATLSVTLCQGQCNVPLCTSEHDEHIITAQFGDAVIHAFAPLHSRSQQDGNHVGLWLCGGTAGICSAAAVPTDGGHTPTALRGNATLPGVAAGAGAARRPRWQ